MGRKIFSPFPKCVGTLMLRVILSRPEADQFTSINCQGKYSVKLIYLHSHISLRGMHWVKAVTLQAWSGQGGFQEVKVPRFHDKGTGWW
jgi:hypothetical protein